MGLRVAHGFFNFHFHLFFDPEGLATFLQNMLGVKVINISIVICIRLGRFEQCQNLKCLAKTL